MGIKKRKLTVVTVNKIILLIEIKSTVAMMLEPVQAVTCERGWYIVHRSPVYHTQRPITATFTHRREMESPVSLTACPWTGGGQVPEKNSESMQTQH